MTCQNENVFSFKPTGGTLSNGATRPGNGAGAPAGAPVRSIGSGGDLTLDEDQLIQICARPCTTLTMPSPGSPSGRVALVMSWTLEAAMTTAWVSYNQM